MAGKLPAKIPIGLPTPTPFPISTTTATAANANANVTANATTTTNAANAATNGNATNSLGSTALTILSGAAVAAGVIYLGYKLSEFIESNNVKNKKKNDVNLFADAAFAQVDSAAALSPTSSASTAFFSSGGGSNASQTGNNNNSSSNSIAAVESNYNNVNLDYVTPEIILTNGGEILALSLERAVKTGSIKDFAFDSSVYSSLRKLNIQDTPIEVRLRAAEWLVAAETVTTQLDVSNANRKREEKAGISTPENEKPEIDIMLPIIALITSPQHVEMLQLAWDFMERCLPASLEERRNRHRLRLIIAWKLQNMQMMSVSYEALNSLSTKDLMENLYCFFVAPHLGKWNDFIKLGDELIKTQPSMMDLIFACSWQMHFECRYPNYSAIYDLVKQLNQTPEGQIALKNSITRQVPADFSVTHLQVKFLNLNCKDKKYKMQTIREMSREPFVCTTEVPIRRVGSVITWQGVMNAIPVAGVFVEDTIYLSGWANVSEGSMVIKTMEEFELKRNPAQPHVWKGLNKWKRVKISGSGPLNAEHDTAFEVEMIMKCATRKAIEEEVKLNVERKINEANNSINSSNHSTNNNNNSTNNNNNSNGAYNSVGSTTSNISSNSTTTTENEENIETGETGEVSPNATTSTNSTTNKKKKGKKNGSNSTTTAPPPAAATTTTTTN